MGLRMLSTVVGILLVVLSMGCSITKPATVPKDDYIPAEDEKILSVTLLVGGDVVFDSEGGRYDRDNRVIRGTSKAGVTEEISIDDVQFVQVDRIATGLSLTATFAGLLTMALIIMYTIGVHAQWFSN